MDLRDQLNLRLRNHDLGELVRFQWMSACGTSETFVHFTALSEVDSEADMVRNQAQHLRLRWPTRR